MSAAKIMADYANLATVHEALHMLVGMNLITREEQMRLTRKYMDDRPDFKAAVAKAMGGTVESNNPPSTEKARG